MSGIKKHIDILIDYLNLENVGMILASGYGYLGASKEKQYLEEPYQPHPLVGVMATNTK